MTARAGKPSFLWDLSNNNYLSIHPSYPIRRPDRCNVLLLCVCDMASSELPLTFVVYEEGVGRQRVLVVGDVLQDVRQVHVHPDHAQQEVAEVTGSAHRHDKTWWGEKFKKILFFF